MSTTREDEDRGDAVGGGGGARESSPPGGAAERGGGQGDGSGHHRPVATVAGHGVGAETAAAAAGANADGDGDGDGDGDDDGDDHPGDGGDDHSGDGVGVVRGGGSGGGGRAEVTGQPTVDDDVEAEVAARGGAEIDGDGVVEDPSRGEAASDSDAAAAGSDNVETPAAAASAAAATSDDEGKGVKVGRRGRPKPTRPKPKGKKKMGRPKGSKTRLRWIQVPASSVSKYQQQQDEEDEDDDGDGDDGGDTDRSDASSGYCSDHRPSPPTRKGGGGKKRAKSGSGDPPNRGKKKKAKGMIRPPPKRPRAIRRRTHDSGTDNMEQPHVSMAYQAMDDALAEKELVQKDIEEARRKVADAQKILDAAIARDRDADVDIRRRRDDIMEAELAVPSRWNEMYRRLAAFQLEHGHTLLSKRMPGLLSGTDNVDPELAKWTLDQRTHLKTKLNKHDPASAGAPKPNESESDRRKRVMNRRSDYRIAALDRLGFVWNENEALWDIMLRQLIDYHRENGDCHVPQRYKPNPPLGKWVSGQRTHYRLLKEGRPSQMTPERIRRLEEAGFAWESNFPRTVRETPRQQQTPPPRKKTEGELWEERFHQFAEFRATHGHGHLYQHRGVTGPMLQLCLWAGYQRKQYKLYKAGKPSLLTEERVERLDSLGFYWKVRGTRDDIPSRLRAKAAAEAASGDGGGDAAPQHVENATARDEAVAQVEAPAAAVPGSNQEH